MEVAGQWRREWAGAAEYGKVTQDGVTRRVARAMEVLHASAPGAQVRVMRAAYHSTSGPGLPASSYMLHSSRRVISSGFNILESPTFPSKPLEISSTPLESSPETETEHYKVTEPDDMDISEPSKWRGTTGGNSIRMPSEESSSTDNASIVELDSRSHKGLHRKYSYDSENSDIHSIKRNTARASPLLDAPVALSTLKYKSLLNSSNEWNNRRKSYSFEDTSPLNEIMVQSNDTLAMESSTDSGICKSSEIVNDYSEDTHKLKDFVGREHRINNYRNDPSDYWHRKNKQNMFNKGPKIKSYKEHDIVIEDPHENNIALQSTGKVTITVPITIEGADDDRNKKFQLNDEADRRVKRVEFCKTELHFAAESGKVNIIATDEKPPPSNDFRKRRSAFVPINDKFERPITLFGEKNDVPEMMKPDVYGIRDVSESEFDENTAATKSILKNKIPKPKPYLLGENMAFGDIQDMRVDQSRERSVSMGVSLVNKELETQRISHHKEAVHNFTNVTNKGFTDSFRTVNKGPLKNNSSSAEKHSPEENYYLHDEIKTNSDSIRQKFSALQMSPVPKPKTRQLRESDLMFFGIDNHKVSSNSKKHIEPNLTRIKSNFINDTFESVRLIKQISSSNQNSEAESDDSPDYQNIPIKSNYTPVPIPRSRTKYKTSDDDVKVLRPIIEKAHDSSITTQETRRSRNRKQDEFTTISSRSRSEPAKQRKSNNAVHKDTKQGLVTERCKGYLEDKVKQKLTDDVNLNCTTDDNVPIYANLEAKTSNKHEVRCDARMVRADAVTKTKHDNMIINERKNSINKSVDTVFENLDMKQNNAKKNNRVHRTEKLSTPENTSSINKIKDIQESRKSVNSINGNNKNSNRKKEYRNSSSQRANKDSSTLDKKEGYDIKKSKVINEDNTKEEKRQNSKDRYTNKTENTKSSKSTDQNSTEYRTHSKELRPVNKDSNERGTNTNSRRTSRRSEYVIKYDDKNGTVSSISKVRAGHSASRQKHASKDRHRETSKDAKIKSKNYENSALRNAAPRSSDCERKKRR